jgi:glutamate-ammonia-ligase adenylyltransferase
MTKFESLIQPDLFLWEQLEQILTQRNITDSVFIESLEKLALGSNYAITQLTRYPDLIDKLVGIKNFDLDQLQLIDGLSNVNDPEQIKRLLRLFRHQKLVEIIYLDICKNESVENTLRCLTRLADILIQQALLKAEQISSAKHGQPVDHNGDPMQLNIIGMGKLGGGELNFSSDIDLIFSYSDDGQLKGFGQLSYNQYFTNVVKLFNQFLHEVTADGFVYRVDLRLRPWGNSGPVVLSHNAFEHYYQLHGREWEQYAMVKARILSGTESDKKHLQSILKPFVYRRYHDYRVFDGLAQLKHKIDNQAKSKGARCNVKIGRGGIREIEFFVQAFQILKGGRNHQLQTQSIYKTLKVLAEHELVDAQTLSEMHDSYNFLRLLENRIQMQNDQQTHEIPQKQNLLQRMSLLMGYADWPALELELERHQSRVNNLFSALFRQSDEQLNTDSTVQNLDELSTEEHKEIIRKMDFQKPDEIHQKLTDFYHSKALLYMSDKAKKRFRVFFPELLNQVCGHSDQIHLLDKLLALLSSISGRSVYFELLYQNIPLLVKLVHLYDSSDWIASEVTRHPFLLESLLYPGDISDRFAKQQLTKELAIQLKNVAGDEEMELDILRQFKRMQTIVIATAEIALEIDTNEVSRYLADLAEILLQAIYDLAWQQLVDQYGDPECIENNVKHNPTMGIIAYGKLGGFELHYQSDLDIIFLHNSSGKSQQTSGDKVIDNATFFSRLAQTIISKISLLTAAGKLYEIDTRLRPDGASGMLVSSLTAYQQYQQEKAWVWEHQAIIRARYIAGSQAIAEPFNSIRTAIVRQSRDIASVKQAIIEMRDKMYQARNPVEGKRINIKHSHGGMIDIEFMVQYMVLVHANKFASLSQTTDNIGLISELHHLGLISDDFLQLRDIYQTFHKWLHSQVLQNQSAEIQSDLVHAEIDLVRACWNKTFNN